MQATSQLHMCSFAITCAVRLLHRHTVDTSLLYFAFHHVKGFAVAAHRSILQSEMTQAIASDMSRVDTIRAELKQAEKELALAKEDLKMLKQYAETNTVTAGDVTYAARYSSMFWDAGVQSLAMCCTNARMHLGAAACVCSCT